MLTSTEYTNNGAGISGISGSNGGYRPATNRSREWSPSEKRNFTEIIGETSALKKVLREVEVVAQTDATVLIMGETGTGKELIAKAVHQSSRRAKNTYVKELVKHYWDFLQISRLYSYLNVLHGTKTMLKDI